MITFPSSNEIERKIFQGYSLSFSRLLTFGFVYEDDSYLYKTSIRDFDVYIKVSAKGEVKASLFDIDTQEEYTNYRLVETNGFASEVKEELVSLLIKIRDICAIKNSFLFPQTGRLLQKVKEIYGDEYETPWGKEEDGLIVRNPKTKKWYLLVMRVDGKHIDPSLLGTQEVINLKIDESLIPDLIKENGIYPAYHMNKKYWISVLLDDSHNDDELLDLIAMSHKYSEKK